MRGEWSVFDRPANSSGLLAAERPWGSETSTSYSVSSFALQTKCPREPSKRDAHRLSFSLSPEVNQPVGRHPKFAASRTHCLKQQRRQIPLAAFASISSAMSDKLSIGRGKQQMPRRTPMAFEVSSMQPDMHASQHAHPLSHQPLSLMTHSNCQQQQQLSQSVILDCFELRDTPSTSSPHPRFASISLAQRNKRKRQPVNIGSQSLPQSGAVQSSLTAHQNNRQGPVMDIAQNSAIEFSSTSANQGSRSKDLAHSSATVFQFSSTAAVQGSRSGPVMDLAQNSATVFGASSEEEHRGKGGADVKASGQQLKKSVLKMPSQLRRLFAGAFAGKHLKNSRRHTHAHDRPLLTCFLTKSVSLVQSQGMAFTL